MNNNGFAKEPTDIVNSITGVVLSDNRRYSINKFPVLGQNLIMVLEASFNRIADGKSGYLSGIEEIDGKDYILLNYSGTDALIDLGLPSKKLHRLDVISKENDIGYGMRVIPKNHNSIPYALHNVVSSAGLVSNSKLSDSEVFGPREEVRCDVDEHNYVKPNMDTYDLVMSHFTKN